MVNDVYEKAIAYILYQLQTEHLNVGGEKMVYNLFNIYVKNKQKIIIFRYKNVIRKKQLKMKKYVKITYNYYIVKYTIILILI